MGKSDITGVGDDGGTGRAEALGLRDLYACYSREMEGFVRRKVGDGPPDPEDIVQQTFANFVELKRPESIRNPRAFLYRIASNLIVNHFRRAVHARNFAILERNLAQALGARDEASPEIVLLDREAFAQVAAAVETLPRRRRRFLLLNRVEGMSYSEIARRNGVSEGTVRRDVELAVIACGRSVRVEDAHGDA